MRKLWLAVALFALAGAASAQVAISEIYVNSPGSDQGFESLELSGPPGFSLSGWYFIVIEADDPSSGIVDLVVNLGSYSLGSNGLLLVRDAATPLNPAPAAETNVVVFDFNPDIENGGNTYVLGFGAPPAVGADLDNPNDGLLDAGALAGFTVADAVAYQSADDVGREYAGQLGGIDLGAFSFTPDALYRIFDCATDAPLAWAGGDVLGTNPGPYNWDAAESFGWGDYGVPNPATRTLDLGSENYRFGCVGACCLAGGFCEQVTPAECATAAGAYQGDGTGCVPGLCPATPGACCLFDGSCQIATEGDCVDFIGGAFQGAGSACVPGICPEPPGACCADGACTTQTESACAAVGGVYGGDGSVCNSFTCLGPGDFFLTEVFLNAPGTDDGAEFVEIQGPPSTSLAGWWLIVIDGDLGVSPPAGVVDQLIDLSAFSTGSNGLLLIRDAATSLDPAPAAETSVVVLNFDPDLENGATTIVLAQGAPDFALGADLDANNDGSLDAAWPGITRVDAISFVNGDEPGVDYADDLGGEAFGDLGTYTPDAIYRVLDCAGVRPLLWVGGDVFGAAPGPFFWDGAEFFGFDRVGIFDPSLFTLDPGIRNMIYGCPACAPGDSNCDAAVNFDDIDCFVAALIGESAWNTCGAAGDCDFTCVNDIDGNETVNFDDIDPFIICLIGGGCP